jgi:hypothetical protein
VLGVARSLDGHRLRQGGVIKPTLGEHGAGSGEDDLGELGGSH